MNTITLRAADLSSKYGFGDGDVLENVWDELEAEGCSPHQEGLLEAVVERHLQPLMPPTVRLKRVSSNHNPIRIHHDDDTVYVREVLRDINVDITVEQVLAVAKELKR